MKEKIPSEKECIEILKECGAGRELIEHSKRVEKLGEKIAEKLIARGVKVDLGLVKAGALLHDADKMDALKNKPLHGKKAFEVLSGKGFGKVAWIARKHVLESVLDEKMKPKSWEEKIVFYADKRVNPEGTVSLDERYGYMRERYGKISGKILDKINKTERIVKEMEKELFEAMGEKI